MSDCVLPVAHRGAIEEPLEGLLSGLKRLLGWLRRVVHDTNALCRNEAARPVKVGFFIY